MSLVQPSWLLLLIILPMIVVATVLSQRASSKAWQQMVAARLRKQLVREGSHKRRWVSMIMGLLACVLLIVVVARPYGGATSISEQIRSRNIIIAIDTSRSMLVEDVAPNRMSAAKAMALELIQTFRNDRIGVIAFSGAAVSMAPLTIDHTAVHETIRQLDTTVIPSGGSDLAAAVDLALETFKKSERQSNALIIISDGEDHSEKIQFAGSEIRDAGIAVCTIGVGSTDGGIIPDRRTRDGKFRDLRGNTVFSKLNPSALQQLANAGGGSYVPASSGADQTIRQALASLEKTHESGRVIEIPNETYQWYLCPAIILLILSGLIRSHLFAGRIPKVTAGTFLLLLSLFGTQSLEAAKITDRALAAYQEKDYPAAMELFAEAMAETQGNEQRVLEFAQGSTAYQLKRWDVASRYFSRALLSKDEKLQEQSHYNLGNTLFQYGWTTLNPAAPDTGENPFLEPMRKLYSQRGKPPEDPSGQAQLTEADIRRIKTNWQDAISHYQASLLLNADNSKTGDNLKEVERLLKELEQAQQQAKQEAEQEQQQQSEQQQEGEGDSQDQQQDKGDQPKDDKGQQGEQDQDAGADSSGQQEGEHPQNQDDIGDDELQQPDQHPEESEEEFAARILREQSDAEVRPVRRRLMQLRRPEKDW